MLEDQSLAYSSSERLHSATSGSRCRDPQRSSGNSAEGEEGVSGPEGPRTPQGNGLQNQLAIREPVLVDLGPLHVNYGCVAWSSGGTPNSGSGDYL